MTQSNLNLILSNSLCCISKKAAEVSDLYSIGNSCADSEFIKLQLMNDWYESLRCYNLTIRNSEFINVMFIDMFNSLFNVNSKNNIIYTIAVNGIIYSAQGDNTTLVIDLIQNLMLSIPNIISYDIYETGSITEQHIVATCDVKEIIISVLNIETGLTIRAPGYNNIIEGICELDNCLSEKQFDRILNNLMKACNICECQLPNSEIIKR